jgi:hypothetical protein
MRVAWIALFSAAAAAGVRADDCCVEGQVKPWKLYGAGIRWHNPPRGSATSDRSDPLKLARNPSWDDAYKSALERARKEKKLVLYFQLVGELDLEGC